MQEQYEIAETVREFVKQYGLAKTYVAQCCNIPRACFSSWLNHKRAITDKQLKAISEYMADYRQRMS